MPKKQTKWNISSSSKEVLDDINNQSEENEMEDRQDCDEDNGLVLNDGAEDSGDDDDDDDDSEEEVDDGLISSNMDRNNKRKLNHEDDMPASKRRNKVYTKLPTAEEWEYRHETDTEDRYHGTLFKLLMEEMMININMKSSNKIKLEVWLGTFTKFLKHIPAATEPIDLCDTSSYTANGVQMPLDLPNVGGSFQFAPPSNVSFTGSFSNGTVTNAKHNVIDLMIEVPQSCIDSKDNRNGRWLVKRAHYLAHIAAALQGCDSVHGDDVVWSLHLGEPLRPVLLVSPAVGSSRRWRVQLLPVPAPEAFKVHAFAPLKVNIKQRDITACQMLNFLCCVDTAMAANNAALADTLTKMPDMAEGVKLLKVWFGQRQLSKGRGSFSGHFISMLVLHMYRKGDLTEEMSGFQVFRVVLKCLVDSDYNWTVNGVNMYEHLMTTSKDAVVRYPNTITSTERYHEMYPVVFVDPSGYCNLAATLTPQIMRQMQQEARHGSKLLSSNSLDSFELLFIKRLHFEMAFDQSINIKITKKALHKFYSPDKATTAILLLNQLHPAIYGQSEDTVSPVGEVTPMVSELCELVRRGLGERVSLVVQQLVAPPQWDLSAAAPARPVTITFGFMINPAEAWNLLIKDTADKPDEFREFWGELSNLRRYKDGEICETVAWGDGVEGEGDRRAIPVKIARHLLHRHYALAPKNVVLVGTGLEDMLRLPKTHPDAATYCTGEASCRSAVLAYDALKKVLRSLSMPLAVTNVVSTSSVVAQSEVFPRELVGAEATVLDQLNALNEACGPMEVLVFLESSGKWPTELAGVNAVRQDFQRVMHQLLRKQRVTTSLREDRVLVVLRGYAFSLRITYPGEVYLLKKQDGIKELQEDEEESNTFDTPASLQMEMRTKVEPKLVTALASLCSRYPSYSGCVRLCRRWLKCLMMEPHMPALVTQLLVASLYMNPGEFQTPRTPYVGFLRFLSFLSTTDFDGTPVFVDFNDTFLSEDVALLRSQFRESRSSFPPLCLVTPFDVRGNPDAVKEGGGVASMEGWEMAFRYKLVSECSRPGPHTVILTTVQKLARAALELCLVNVADNTFDYSMIFQPVTTYYDLTIQLDSQYIPRLEENVNYDTMKKPKVKHSTGTKARQAKKVLRNAPMTVVDILEDLYGENGYVCYDKSAGEIIGLAFSPEARKEKEVKNCFRNEMEMVSREPRRAVLSLQMTAALIEKMCQPVVKWVELKQGT